MKTDILTLCRHLLFVLFLTQPSRLFTSTRSVTAAELVSQLARRRWPPVKSVVPLIDRLVDRYGISTLLASATTSSFRSAPTRKQAKRVVCMLVAKYRLVFNG